MAKIGKKLKVDIALTKIGKNERLASHRQRLLRRKIDIGIAKIGKAKE